MRSLFAVAFIAATAFAAEDAAAADAAAATPAAEEGPKWTVSQWTAKLDATLNKSTVSGEYWTVPGLEGAHVLNFTSKVVTDSTAKATASNWFFTTYAFQRKAPAAAPAGDGAARMLAEEAAAAPAVDTLWDTIICGQKLVAVAG